MFSRTPAPSTCSGRQAKTKEVQDPEAVREMRRKKFPEVSGKYSDENKFIVYFSIDRVLPLVGDKEG
jgi:hypothetical protein